MAAESHPFPSRTRQLSPPAPMVLGGRPPGRVGRRRISPVKERPRSAGSRSALLQAGHAGRRPVPVACSPCPIALPVPRPEGSLPGLGERRRTRSSRRVEWQARLGSRSVPGPARIVRASAAEPARRPGRADRRWPTGAAGSPGASGRRSAGRAQPSGSDRAARDRPSRCAAGSGTAQLRGARRLRGGGASARPRDRSRGRSGRRSGPSRSQRRASRRDHGGPARSAAGPANAGSSGERRAARVARTSAGRSEAGRACRRRSSTAGASATAPHARGAPPVEPRPLAGGRSAHGASPRTPPSRRPTGARCRCGSTRARCATRPTGPRRAPSAATASPSAAAAVCRRTSSQELERARRTPAPTSPRGPRSASARAAFEAERYRDAASDPGSAGHRAPRCGVGPRAARSDLLPPGALEARRRRARGLPDPHRRRRRAPRARRLLPRARARGARWRSCGRSCATPRRRPSWSWRAASWRPARSADRGRLAGGHRPHASRPPASPAGSRTTTSGRGTCWATCTTGPGDPTTAAHATSGASCGATRRFADVPERLAAPRSVGRTEPRADIRRPSRLTGRS